MPFKGRVLTEWLSLPPKNNRKMLLEEDFIFVDKTGKE